MTIYTCKEKKTVNGESVYVLVNVKDESETMSLNSDALINHIKNLGVYVDNIRIAGDGSITIGDSITKEPEIIPDEAVFPTTAEYDYRVDISSDSNVLITFGNAAYKKAKALSSFVKSITDDIHICFGANTVIVANANNLIMPVDLSLAFSKICCKSLKFVKADFSSVRCMMGMFYKSNIGTIDLSNVDMSGVFDFSRMFAGAYFGNLILPQKPPFDAAQNMDFMFKDAMSEEFVYKMTYFRSKASHIGVTAGSNLKITLK